MALPDPCRPLDSPVIPAGRRLQDLLTTAPDYPISAGEKLLSDLLAFSSKNEQTTAKSVSRASQTTPRLAQPKQLTPSNPLIKQRHHTDTPAMLSLDTTFNLQQFIQQQQSQATVDGDALTLPLTWLPRMIHGANKTWWEQVMTQHGMMTKQPINDDKTLQQLEKRLLIMGQMYHTLLCVFLLCQCKSRKTLNPHITLQDLTEAINAYAAAHRTELEFLTHQTELIIEPLHVELAVAALGWQVSKHSDIAQRTTTISSHNPLIS